MDKKFKCAVGNRIRIIRGKLGMTQTDLGRALKLSKTAVSGYEIGDACPALDTLTSLAKMGDVSCGWIITGGDDGTQTSLPDTLTPEEKELIGDFRSISHTDQAAILRIVHGLVMMRKHKTNS